MAQCRIIFNSFCHFEWKRSAVMMVTVEILTVRERERGGQMTKLIFASRSSSNFTRYSTPAVNTRSESEWWKWHSRNLNGNQTRKEWKKMKTSEGEKEWERETRKMRLNLQVILRVQNFLRCHEAHVWICHHIHLYRLWPVFDGRSSFFIINVMAYLVDVPFIIDLICDLFCHVSVNTLTYHARQNCKPTEQMQTHWYQVCTLLGQNQRISIATSPSILYSFPFGLSSISIY